MHVSPSCDVFGLRFTAGAFGFLLLIQSRERPQRYGESRRLKVL